MANELKLNNAAMVKIGDILREAREKKGVALAQVHKQTYINVTVLKALEEGKCDTILTQTYIKSYLKKYAHYLGLDIRQLLGEYAVAQPAAAQPAPASVSAVGKVEEKKHINFSKYLPAVKVAGIAVVAIFLVVFVGGKVINLFGAWNASASQAKASRAKGAPAMQISIPKSVPLKLSIHVNEPVLVKIKIDGVSILSKVLARGTTETFTAKDRINVYIAKAELAELVLNDKYTIAAGKGLVKNMEITRSGVKTK